MQLIQLKFFQPDNTLVSSLPVFPMQLECLYLINLSSKKFLTLMEIVTFLQKAQLLNRQNKLHCEPYSSLQFKTKK